MAAQQWTGPARPGSDAQGSQRLRLGLFVLALCALGAKHVTPHFVVTASSPEAAREVAETAERCRRELAVEWTGRELPAWQTACRITVADGADAATSGWTTYSVYRGEMFDCVMIVRGPLDRILDTVLPHEISHTVLVTYLGRLVPRWADEGVALMCETETEQLRQRLLAAQLAKSERSVPLRALLTQAEYPRDKGRMRAFYARGFSLTEFLVGQGGKARYLEFLAAGDGRGWDWAVRHYYGDRDVEALEARWTSWALSDARNRRPPQNLVAADSPHAAQE
ncbi:MAG: hypothetical protein ACREJB_15450 [Planctomycetaceae bacterium]